MVWGPCWLRSVMALACVPTVAWATRSMAAVISCDVLGLITKIVGRSMWMLLHITS